MVLLHAHVDSPVERGITVMGRNIVQMDSRAGRNPFPLEQHRGIASNSD
jgi:hypothetical protein